MRSLTLIAAACLLAGPAFGQVQMTSPAPDAVTVVIYRYLPSDTTAMLTRLRTGQEDYRTRGVAMIVETRTVDVPAGEGVLRFEGLATGVIPQTAVLEGLPAHVIERNTDFDLLSPGSLLQRSIGEVVEVVGADRETGQVTRTPAVVRAGASGPVLEIEGRLQALDCQGLAQRIVFDRVPEGLLEQPVLSVRTRAAEAGRRTVTLAYLATGLEWNADYVAKVRPDGATMDIEGWMTIANFGGGAFENAEVQVVAGNLNHEDDTEALEPVVPQRTPGCWPLDTTTVNTPGVRIVTDYLATVPALSNSLAPAHQDGDVEEVVVTGSRIIARLAELGDYKIYTLPGAADLNPRQAKQVRFFDQQGVRFNRVYSHVLDTDETEDDAEAPRLLLRMRNEQTEGLGVPMPGGGVTLVEGRDGTRLLTGQASFRDRGVGVPIELRFGEAMGVSVSHTLLTEERWREGETYWQRKAVAAVVSNDKAWPIEIEILPAEGDWPGYRVERSSQAEMVTEAGQQGFRLRVPAHGTATLDYTVRYED